MRVIIEPYMALCSLKKFEINGIRADIDDFGYKEDLDPQNAPDYGCGNMSFVSRPSTCKVLDKYRITADEYNQICDQLADALHFGHCGWCI